MKINISEKECSNLHSLIFNFFYKYILTSLRNDDKIIIREMKKIIKLQERMNKNGI